MERYASSLLGVSCILLSSGVTIGGFYVYYEWQIGNACRGQSSLNEESAVKRDGNLNDCGQGVLVLHEQFSKGVTLTCCAKRRARSVHRSTESA